MNDLVVTKRFTFEAAHRLPFHDGKCSRDHGHSYVLEVSVKGQPEARDGLPKSGMVIDFSDLKAAVKPLVDGYLDHHSLNEVDRNPTAERLAGWIANRLTDAGLAVCHLRLYETEDSWVDWHDPAAPSYHSGGAL